MAVPSPNRGSTVRITMSNTSKTGYPCRRPADDLDPRSNGARCAHSGRGRAHFADRRYHVPSMRKRVPLCRAHAAEWCAAGQVTGHGVRRSAA